MDRKTDGWNEGQPKASRAPLFQSGAITRFLQANLSEIQGLFKDFLKTFLLFSRKENL